MDRNLDLALCSLPSGELQSLLGKRGRGIAVFEGRVWLTQVDDPRDLVLDAGESFEFDRHGRVVVQALSDAHMLLFERAAA